MDNSTHNFNFEAIVIGASWGGMSALIRILADLPEDYSLPIVVVLHRLRNVKSSLIELINDKVSLTVKEINEKEEALPGNVYIAPANYHILLEHDKTFSFCNSAPVKYSRPSIDVFFESASDVYKDKLLGVLLTGANSDGAKGLETIVRNGGLVVVQDPDEAEVNTMPLAAITTVSKCMVMNLSEINKFFKSLEVNVSD
jgi:two-component system, chemotaxis family, protein-glutamate methylesterase/glutaminase